MTGLEASRHWARVEGPRQRSTRVLLAGRHLPWLASGLLLGGCAGMPGFGPGAAAPPGPPPPALAGAEPVLSAPPGPGGPGGPRVGILLPLSGPNGVLGTGMLRAARLALPAGPGAPALDARDTAGPGGAAAAARLAVQSGDAILLGPLTSADTAAVAPVAGGAAVPVLAFTSDVAQARPGVWVMGVTPEQQVRRLVAALRTENRGRIAALLPSTALGDALAAALARACADAGLAPPTILTHAGTADSIGAAMRQLSDLPGRRAAQQQAVAAPLAPAAPVAPVAPAAPPASQTPAPPSPAAAAPLDALLLGDTGLQLQEVITALRESGIAAPQVRVMGPELWAAFAVKLRALAGAWYVAPDPSDRLGFAQRYRAAYGQAPKPLADIAYDAAALARSLAPGGYGVEALTRPDGFAGVDGVFALKPDGHVGRALAVFQVQPGGGGALVQAASRRLPDAGPGS